MKPTTQHCPQCDKTKPIGEFPRNAGGGRRRTCRACGPRCGTPTWQRKERLATAKRRLAQHLARQERARRASALVPLGVVPPAAAESRDES
jgi:hypothetical protein